MRYDYGTIGGQEIQYDICQGRTWLVVDGNIIDNIECYSIDSQRHQENAHNMVHELFGYDNT